MSMQLKFIILVLTTFILIYVSFVLLPAFNNFIIEYQQWEKFMKWMSLIAIIVIAYISFKEPPKGT